MLTTFIVYRPYFCTIKCTIKKLTNYKQNRTTFLREVADSIGVYATFFANKKYKMRTILIITLLVLQSFSLFAQYNWEQTTSLPASQRERVFSFAIDDIIYIGGGRTSNNSNTNEFWAYDTMTQTWEQKANFPGGTLRNGSGFSIGAYGYAGLGYNGSSYVSTFWRYSPADDSWIQIADFPDNNIGFATSFANEESGFVCFGGRTSLSLDDYSTSIWQYNPMKDKWSLLTNLPADPRWHAVGMIVNNKIYVGCGSTHQGANYQDFWEYDMAMNSWTQKNDIPTIMTTACLSFSLNEKIFIMEGANSNGLGSSPLLQIYDTESDSWTSGLNFIGIPRVLGFSKSIGNAAYIGLGINPNSNNLFNDVYKFTEEVTAIETLNEIEDALLFPNPTHQKVTLDSRHVLPHLSIYNKEGILLSSKYQEGGHREIDLSEFGGGIYFLVLKNEKGSAAYTQKVIKK